MKKLLLSVIKFLRLIGSLGFVIGLFVSIFVGMPWYLYHEPTLPLWLKIAVFSLMGGLLLVLITVAAEQASVKPKKKELEEKESGGGISLQNSSEVPGREIQENLGLVQGHTIYAIWIGKDLSSIHTVDPGWRAHRVHRYDGKSPADSYTENAGTGKRSGCGRSD